MNTTPEQKTLIIFYYLQPNIKQEQTKLKEEDTNISRLPSIFEIDNTSVVLQYQIVKADNSISDINNATATIQIGTHQELIINNMSDVKMKFNFKTSLDKDKKYSCLIFRNKINQIYYFQSTGPKEYHYDIYTKHLQKTAIEIELASSYTFECTKLTEELSCFSVFNAPSIIKYASKSINIASTEYNIKLCLYHNLNGNFINSTAHIIKEKEIPKMNEDIKKDIYKNLTEYNKIIRMVMDDNIKNDKQKKAKIIELNANSQTEIRYHQYFDTKMYNILDFSEIDFDIYSQLFLYQITYNDNNDEFSLLKHQYNLMLELINNTKNKSFENAQILSFQQNLICDDIICINQKLKKNKGPIIIKRTNMKQLYIGIFLVFLSILFMIYVSSYLSIVIKIFATIIICMMCCFYIYVTKDERIIHSNYLFAIDFFQKIINNMSPQSSFYKILMQLNCPISVNILDENKEETFELDHITNEEFKNHMEILKNTKVCRYSSIKREAGFTDIYSGMTGINELILYKAVVLDSSEDKYSARLAILMVLLHEIMGHRKMSILSNHNSTPTKYEFQGVMKKCIEDDRGEAGRIIEQIISSEKGHIRYLSECVDDNFAKIILSDLTYWTSNMKALNDYTSKYIQKTKYRQSNNTQSQLNRSWMVETPVKTKRRTFGVRY